MRAWLFTFGSVGLLLAACSGNDVSIGMNDSGIPGDDASTGQDGNTGQDSGNPGMDSSTDDSGNPGKDSGPNPGLDGGTSLDGGGCVPKVFQFQCGQNLCNGGQKQFCSQYPHMCSNIPQACQCNYTCQCLLANIQNPCINMIQVKCSVGGSGALYLSCN
jgi:hypothetical protein